VRAVVQRVTRAAVEVDGECLGQIGPGLVVLVGVSHQDGPRDAEYLANKIAGLRIFPGAGGRFDRSVLEVGGELLVVSQFTLYGDTRKGRRPSFEAAASPEVAEPLIDAFVMALRATGVSVATARFRAHMLVELVNDGPVTLSLDSAEKVARS